jgi:glyoxylate/hydroxypyruvate reductase A
LTANGFSVIGWSRSPKQTPGVETFHGDVGLTEVLKRADILVILVPLTDATKGLINASALKRMKPGASLINFGRGAIVDTAALVNRLNERSLDHAVLDVFAIEPLPERSPLWSHEHVTVLPHISAPTTVMTASKIVADNLRMFFQDGRIPAAVDRRQGY